MNGSLKKTIKIKTNLNWAHTYLYLRATLFDCSMVRLFSHSVKYHLECGMRNAEYGQWAYGRWIQIHSQCFRMAFYGTFICSVLLSLPITNICMQLCHFMNETKPKFKNGSWLSFNEIMDRIPVRIFTISQIILRPISHISWIPVLIFMIMLSSLWCLLLTIF